MYEENVNNWVNNAKSHNSASANAHPVQVIRRSQKQSAPSVGNLIMQVADKIRPHLISMLDGVRNNEGIILQPAHIRGIALEVAEGLVKDHQQNLKQSA